MEGATAQRDRTMLVCYDGSREAAEAISFSAELIAGGRAVIVVVWKPVVEELLAGPSDAPPISDPVEANERQHQTSVALARDGVRRASASGLDAQALVLRTTGPLWLAIEDAAEERNAMLIVCATGRSGVTSALPLNLSSALVQNARRPVLVVPSAKATAERSRAIEKERGVRVKH